MCTLCLGYAQAAGDQSVIFLTLCSLALPLPHGHSTARWEHWWSSTLLYSFLCCTASWLCYRPAVNGNPVTVCWATTIGQFAAGYQPIVWGRDGMSNSRVSNAKFCGQSMPTGHHTGIMSSQTLIVFLLITAEYSETCLFWPPVVQSNSSHLGVWSP